ncbi:MAG: hypothetical protein MUF66_07490 [Gammaproteobacteria bacterium]|nr:hypothetical protein [Gammaproteobacteria bacterium]
MKLYSGNTQDIATDEEALASRADLEGQLAALEERLRELAPGDPRRDASLLERARTLLRLERNEDAWMPARQAFDGFLARRDWEGAVEACEAMFLTEQPESLAALGQGVWIAVTFPVNPEVSVEMLRRIVEETPDDADGAAVAAAAAHYLADLRAEGAGRDNLLFYTAQMLSSVARRHSQVESQEQFDLWRQRLELDQPDKFLVRLRNVVDVLVQDDWWVDREAIHAELPVN